MAERRGFAFAHCITPGLYLYRESHLPKARTETDHVPRAHLQSTILVRTSCSPPLPLLTGSHNVPEGHVQTHIRHTEVMSEHDAKIASLAARLNEPSTSGASTSHTPAPDLDDDDIFAELEAEIENDSSAAFREHGMEQLKRE